MIHPVSRARATTALLTFVLLAASAACSPGGPPDTGFNEAGVPFGCANGGPRCIVGQVCCAGVPYGLEGRCQYSCGAVSDRSRKQDITAVDPDAILATLARLPVSSWSYRSEPGVRHVGPMAQDFRASFGLGDDDRVIHPIDESGVTIAAIQALYQRVLRDEQSIAALQAENRALRERVEAAAWAR